VPTTIPQITEAMRYILTDLAAATARSSGFVQRRSKLTGPLFAQTLVFGWWANPAATLDDLVETAETLGCDLTPQALHDRFSPQAAAFLFGLLQATAATAIQADPVAIPLLRRFTEVVITDSTVINLPPALQQMWAGCGNSAGTTAALKVLVRLGLVRGGLDTTQLVPGRVHDGRAARALPALPAGALHLGDLGFFDLPQYAAWDRAGVYWLSRLRGQTALYWPDGTRFELAAWLEQADPPRAEYAILLGAAQRIPCRLLVERVPAEVAAARRAALAEEAHRRQQPVRAAAWTGAGWTLYVTNAPAALLSLAEGLVLAHARWQIELLFQRWKSLGQVDEWRSTQPWRILCEVYAKLIGLLLQHWLVVLGCWANADRSLRKATATAQRYGRRITAAWGEGRRLEMVVSKLRRALQRRCRINKQANRPALYQLLLDPRLRDKRRPSVPRAAA
jgi:Transposase DDE domain